LVGYVVKIAKADEQNVVRVIRVWSAREMVST
jgi:hypothetical protein